MAEALKNMYSADFIFGLANDISGISNVSRDAFQALVFDEMWGSRELKERGRHIARCLHQVIPGSFEEQVKPLYDVAQNYSGYTAIIFSDFVELFGLNHWASSMEAMEVFTQRCTAEFAVRPFFKLDFERMVMQHLHWSKSTNEHIRRLASEGIRPRLPWGAGIPRLKKEPEHIFPILENLMMDELEYVRRSVANNLNDISKDYPELVLDFVKDRDLNHRNTQRLVKHALRGLLKKAHPEALALFGFHDSVELSHVVLNTAQSSIQLGETLNWNFSLEAKGSGKLRLEYHVHYQKANGKTSVKVFQLSEQSIEGFKKLGMDKKLSFQDLSTRKHYPGMHRIVLVANGKDVGEVEVSAFAEKAHTSADASVHRLADGES